MTRTLSLAGFRLDRTALRRQARRQFTASSVLLALEIAVLAVMLWRAW